MPKEGWGANQCQREREKNKSSKAADPFKTRKTREPEPQSADTITPPQEVALAIDAFRDCQEQAKHFEGEATVHKDVILEFSQGAFAKRALNGMNRSFKILGEQSMVTYVVMDASAGITDEELEGISERWGEKAADDLVTRDLGSIRFDPEVLAANYEAVVEALKTLPDEVWNNLFKPMLMKAKPGAAEKAKHYAKNVSEYRELIRQLKIKNYIR